MENAKDGVGNKLGFGSHAVHDKFSRSNLNRKAVIFILTIKNLNARINASKNSYRSDEMIQSLDRAMLILSILEQKNTASVTEIAEELSVSKSTVSRLMETLKKHDMVQVDLATKKYRLGFRILYLGEGVKRNINIIATARPFLSKLYDELDESVHLCAFNNDAVYVVDQVQSNKIYNLSATVGMTEPLHSSSVGKCILAFRSPIIVARLLKDYPLTAYTPKTITNSNNLMQHLATIRDQGYAIDDEEITLGVRCIAAPVYNYRGDVNYSLGVSGTTNNIKPSTIDRYVSALLSASRQISFALGYKRNSQTLAAQNLGPYVDLG